MKRYIGLFIVVFVSVVAAMFFYQWGTWKLRASTYEARAHLVNGMSFASQYKMYVAEYYNSRGRLPDSNDAIGLPEPEKIDIDVLDRLEIRDGEIVATFDERTGVDGGQVRLVPDTSKSELGIQWSCLTNSYKDIQSWAPQCAYE